MKKAIGSALICCGILFSGFTALNFRHSFSYEIFSAPYYKTLKKTLPAADAKIGFLPVMLDEHARQNPTFQAPAIPQLMQTITHYLADSLRLQVVSLPPTPEKEFPDVFLGSVLGPQKPMYVLADCKQEKEYPEYCLRLAAQMGSKTWAAALKNQMVQHQLDYVVLYQLGEGYIYPNGKMKKANALAETRKAPQAGLDMGTDFWLPMSQKLVATNKPIDVLFLKGLLIDQEGKVVRFGAEGITAASKAGFLEQAANIAHEFSETELNSIEKDLRRTDLPEAPLNWQKAAFNLTRQLNTSRAGLK